MIDTQQQTKHCCGGQRRTIMPFMVIGIAAILVGGLLAAAVAHAPSRHLVWLVAYLVLIVGLAQIAFSLGQTTLADKPIRQLLAVSEVALFNIGNLGVIVGTLSGSLIPVVIGTVLLLLGLGTFLYGSRGVGKPRLRRGYQSLLGLVALGALVGLALAAFASIR